MSFMKDRMIECHEQLILPSASYVCDYKHWWVSCSWIAMSMKSPTSDHPHHEHEDMSNKYVNHTVT